jgi:hypothetical protein
MLTLTDDNYYSAEANKEYMSVSQYKYWIECEAMSYAKYIENSYEHKMTEAMYLGQYFHSFIDGTTDTWLAMYGNKIRNANGKKSAEMVKVENAWQRASQDKLFMYSIQGTHEEIFISEIGGVKWKSKLDVVNRDNNFFSDGKTCADFKDYWLEVYDEEQGKLVNRKVPFYIANKYDLQLAIYEVSLRQNGLTEIIPLLSCVTKEKIPDIKVLEFTGELWEERFKQLINYVEAKLIRIQDIKGGITKPVRCEKCDYCMSTKVLTEPEIARLY